MDFEHVFQVKAYSREKGFKVDVEARQHKLIVDEPKELGGTDKGANPIEYLLAALASCLSIAIRFHAHKKKIQVDEIEVEAKGMLDLRGFMGMEGYKPGLQWVEVNLKVKSPEPEEKIRELVEFVEAHCPVADTLRAQTNVRLNLTKI